MTDFATTEFACDGLLEMGPLQATAMPCEPIGLMLDDYTFPEKFFSSTDQAEAAARVLSFSRNAGYWCGVSRKALSDMMDDDSRLQHDHKLIAERNGEAIQQMAQYRRRVKLTFGLYGYFAKKPLAAIIKPAPLPKTQIFDQGHRFVLDGVRKLIQNGMLEQITVAGEGVYLFPTPKLVKHLLKSQEDHLT